MSWFLNRWFNLPPYRSAEHIQAANGKKFWILWRSEDEDIAKFRVYYYGRPVGYVNVVKEDDQVLCLADIFIKEEYQRLGLGKQMMNILIQRSRQIGYKEIYGHIVPRDNMTFEYLREWYTRQGFKVDGNYILLDLQ
jgi:GNAT superfamily N-acetyltransferase